MDRPSADTQRSGESGLGNALSGKVRRQLHGGEHHHNGDRKARRKSEHKPVIFTNSAMASRSHSAYATTMPNRINLLRAERGWSQQHLADLLETTPQTVSRLERGDRGVGPWLGKLACAFGVRQAEIIEDLSDLRTGHNGRHLYKDTKQVRFDNAWGSLTETEKEVFLAALEGMAARPGEGNNNVVSRRRKRG